MEAELGGEMLDGMNWWQLRQEYLRVRQEVYRHHREISTKLAWTAEVKRRMDVVAPLKSGKKKGRR